MTTGAAVLDMQDRYQSSVVIVIGVNVGYFLSIIIVTKVMLRIALFRVLPQQVAVISYICYLTTCQSQSYRVNNHLIFASSV